MPKDEWLVSATQMTPTFTPLGGATSTLKVDPRWFQWGWFDWAVGRIWGGFFATEGIYDPPGYELTDEFGNRYLIEVDGGLVRMTDRVGNTIDVTDAGLVVSNGPDLLWQRDDEGRITRLDLPDGGRLLYDIDGAGDLVRVTYPDDVQDTYDYDDAHRLTAHGPLGRAPTRSVTYDADGRVASVVEPGGVTVQTGMDFETNTLTTVGPDPELATEHVFDLRGNVVSETLRFPISSGSPTVLTTTFAYDHADRLVERVNPDGSVESWGYDAQGDLAYARGADGVARMFEHVDGELVGIYEEGTTVRTITRDAGGLPSEIRTGTGTLEMALTWDGLGRVTSLTSASGQTVTYEYGPDFLVSRRTVRDANGDVVAIVVPTYDAASRIVEQATTIDGVTTTRGFSYDARGRIDGLRDELGNWQRYGYADLGGLARYTSPDGRFRTWTYDDAGRLLEATNRAGETLTFGYDAAGRPAAISVADIDRTFVYDPVGRLLVAQDGDEVLTQVWDALGVVSQTMAAPGVPTASYAFQRLADGRVTELEGPTLGGVTRTATYGYDDLGVLNHLDDADLGSFDWTFDRLGRVDALGRPGNTPSTQFTYQDDHQVTGMATGGHAFAYAYDNGLVSQFTDPAGAHTVTRDGRNRVTGVSHPVRPDEAYGFDQADRRTAWSGNPSTSVRHDVGGRLVEDNDFTYLYDPEGRRTQRTRKVGGAVTTYDWNELSQLVGLTDEDGTVWAFGYDAFGRRVHVAATSGAVTTYEARFVYDISGNVRAVLDGSGTVVREYVTGAAFGEVLARVEGGVTTYPLRDRLGTVVSWMDAAGAVVQTVDRTAYGERDVLPTAVEPYGFTGHAEDPTGLVWGRARYYEPATGTWLSEDPAANETRYNYGRGRVFAGADVTGTSYIEGLLYFDHRVKTGAYDGLKYVWALKAAQSIQRLVKNLELANHQAYANREVLYFTPFGEEIMWMNLHGPDVIGSVAGQPECLIDVCVEIVDVVNRITAVNVAAAEADPDKLAQLEFVDIRSNPPVTRMLKNERLGPLGGVPPNTLVAKVPDMALVFETDVTNFVDVDTDPDTSTAMDCDASYMTKFCGGSQGPNGSTRLACTNLVPKLYAGVDDDATCDSLRPTTALRDHLVGAPYDETRHDVPVQLVEVDASMTYLEAESLAQSLMANGGSYALVKRTTPFWVDAAPDDVRYFVFLLAYNVEWIALHTFGPDADPDAPAQGVFCNSYGALDSTRHHEYDHTRVARRVFDDADRLFRDAGESPESSLERDVHIGIFSADRVQRWGVFDNVCAPRALQGTRNVNGLGVRDDAYTDADQLIPPTERSVSKKDPGILVGRWGDLERIVASYVFGMTGELHRQAGEATVLAIDQPRACLVTEERGGTPVVVTGSITPTPSYSYVPVNVDCGFGPTVPGVGVEETAKIPF